MFESDIDAEACSTDCRHPAVIEPLLGRSLGAYGAREVAELFVPRLTDVLLKRFRMAVHYLNALIRADNCTRSDLSYGVTGGTLRSIPSNS